MGLFLRAWMVSRVRKNHPDDIVAASVVVKWLLVQHSRMGP